MMEIAFAVITILGLSLFEVITSLDNAIINAEVLKGMTDKARRWFLTWGIFSSVFLVRGLLPLLVVFLANPGIGLTGAVTSVFSSDPKVIKSIETTAPFLLMGGGVFLIFLFLHWLFLEHKNFGLKGERFFVEQGAWFYAIVAVVLTVVVWFALKADSDLAFSAVLGSTGFFIIHGFRGYAEKQEQKLLRGRSRMSDVSKILYLEVLDASFSVDGVVGAFAFTLFVPFILVGNGLGAVALRQLTVSNIRRVQSYKYLKNGAMYSILFLGTIIVVESFGVHLPSWLSPMLTLTIVLYFYQRSKLEFASVG